MKKLKGKKGKKALVANNSAFIIGNVKNLNNDASTTSTREFDDIRLYKKALTVEQLAEIRQDTSVEDSLVAYWDFEGENALKDNEEMKAHIIKAVKSVQR